MPHITMVIPSLAGGGAERTVLRIAGGLAARGHRVDIVLFQPHVAYPGEVTEAARLVVLCGRSEWARREDADMPAGTVWRSGRTHPAQSVRLAAGLVRDFPAAAPVLLRRAAFGRARRLARYVERERPDILFANLAQAEYAAFFAARLAGAHAFPPIVPVMHGIEKPGTTHTRRRRLLFPAAAHVVAVSRGAAENIAEVVGVPGDRIATIYNPAFTLDIAQLAEEAPGHPWFGAGAPPVVLGVGRLTRPKDFPTLLKAFQHVLAERSCRLVIFGEGPMRADLESRIRALGLQDLVSLPGWAENPYAFMARAALFVLSSRHEGFGNVLVEALACGCPAVSTDCPAGPSEILEDPDLLAPVGDPEALAQIMLRALARPVDKPPLRAKAARFSMDRSVGEYENLVGQLLACHEGKAPT